MTSNLPLLIDQDVKNKNVFLRLDLNTPLQEELSGVSVADASRLEAALPTIKYLLEHKARLVLASHLGRQEQNLSLEPVAQLLGQRVPCEVLFVQDVAGDAPKYLLKDLKPHQIIVLENLRHDRRETQNDSDLAKIWAAYTHVYINDAFGACHRAHASLVALPQLVPQKAAGLLVEREVKMLNSILDSKDRPFVCVLGGAKVSDKIALIENLIDRVDSFVIGGAMAFTFLAALKKSVGRSKVEAKGLQFAKHLIQRLQVRDKKLLLPVDHLVIEASKWSSSNLQANLQALLQTASPTTNAAIPENFMGVDIGPQTRELFFNHISSARLVFLNGPMGVFERGFIEGSQKVLQAAAVAKQQGALSVLGGGDSLALVRQLNMLNELSFVSTGGGASLEYLQHGDLPALQALSS